MDPATRVIYDLCAGTGSWSRPYTEAGYTVREIDIWKQNKDVRLLPFPDDPVHGVLCAPPCTVFANSGARWERSEEDILNGLSIVDACLRFVVMTKPKWWALENPIGKLQTYLGPPMFRFNPCDFGDYYTKQTLLWGSFTVPRFKPVPPLQGSRMQTRGGGGTEVAQRRRAITPKQFARAFFEANA